MLRKYFNQRAIQDKLLLTNLLVTTGALLVVFFMLLMYQYWSFKRDLLQDLNAQIAVVESNLGATVAFDDRQAANETLASLGMNRSVDQAYVLEKDGKLFTHYLSARLKARSHAAGSPVVGIGQIHLHKNIYVGTNPVATLYVDANLNQLNNRVKVFCLALLIAMLLAIIFARLVSRSLNKLITDPIIYLQHLVSSITRQQNYSKRSVLNSEDEIGALSNGINNMLDNINLRDAKLTEELEHRKIVEKRLDQLAYFDHQTTLPNRHAFTAHIRKMIDNSDDNGFYLLLLDLDNFKMVNDTLGHAGGDHLLLECGERLRSILSKEDAVFRIGGDEFAITLLDVKSTADVEKICQRIIHSISQAFLVDHHQVVVGVSIGVIQHRDSNYTESNLVKNADIAMYWAKADGKNTYKFYSKEIEESRYNQQKLISDLQQALKNNEFVLHFQPIISLDTGLIVGFEALIRWQHPQRGLVPPDVFIPLAENTGLIIPIGSWVMEVAIAQIKQWQKDYNNELFININISGVQFHDMTLVQRVYDVIRQNGVNPDYVKFELTESILMEDVSKTIRVLTALRDIGVSIAVDDFGTGHSSMNYLKQFPVNTLKVDKSFVRGLPDDKVDAAIIESIFALARSLELNIVAEGVETEAQLEFLRLHHCRNAQGYLFSRPLPAEEIKCLLEEFNSVISVVSSKRDR